MEKAFKYWWVMYYLIIALIYGVQKGGLLIILYNTIELVAWEFDMKEGAKWGTEKNTS